MKDNDLYIYKIFTKNPIHISCEPDFPINYLCNAKIIDLQ